MKLAVQTGGPEERLGIDQTYRLIAELGFDGVDANVDHLLSYSDIVHKRMPQIFLSPIMRSLTHLISGRMPVVRSTALAIATAVQVVIWTISEGSQVGRKRVEK